MATRTQSPEMLVRTATNLRSEISARNVAHAHETTYGTIPSVLFCEDESGQHGNFHPASYKRILANPEWAERLAKTYTASRRIAHSNERSRGELDCAVSSDALLMNIFCHPQTLRSKRLQTLLNIESGATPAFGFRVRTPLRDGHDDRTEMDMQLDDLLVEAKLSESDFQTARPDLLERYEAFEEAFEIDRLPRSRTLFRSYQLLRGVLAAHHSDSRFAVLMDERRPDLQRQYFAVLAAIRYSHLRSRILMLTWQEVAATLPGSLQVFLEAKYGIMATPKTR
ncbi:PGN_0703 family putative restriction endonuclease [Terriglobus sp. ADX1]|uniref:PGN_0703 family putative restriction endonuclease n=1 Tax=Terriglobus sp. ADX1 TaxID=2794063 RepID=UPI002FE5D6AF